MNILILTGRFGWGHYSVAQALADQVRVANPNDRVEVVDLLEYALPKCSQMVYDSFSFLVNHGAGVYNLFYKISAKSNKTTRLPLSFYFAAELHKRLLREQTDVIISTLPFCSQVVSDYKEKYHSGIRLVTCVTDISCHSEWMHPMTDFYLVASMQTKRALIGRGVSPCAISVCGVPVAQEFKNAQAVTRTADKQLLIMGGGLGLIPIDEEFCRALNALAGVKTTIITGNNQALYERLHNRYANITAVGFTDKVAEYMQNSDLLMTKPGGITLFEAISSELPLVVFPPFLEQEMQNACYIEEQGIGCILSNDIVLCLQQLKSILQDEQQLAVYQSNLQALKQNLDDRVLTTILDGLREQVACA